jgi:hypothetical protein
MSQKKTPSELKLRPAVGFSLIVGGKYKLRILWIELFRCESILLRSLSVMVVIDVLMRRLIGFGVEGGSIDGIAVCRMFNCGLASSLRCASSRMRSTRRLSNRESSISGTFWIQLCCLRLVATAITFHSQS